MSRIVVRCPHCDSDDLHGETGPGGTITLTCGNCAHTWERVPAAVCPHCASTDVDDNAWEGWQWDDREAGTWSHTEETVYVCRKCNTSWQTTRRTESGEEELTKDALRTWTFAEMKEQARDWGLDATGLKRADLVALLLREQDNDHWSREQLARMPKPALADLAKDFGIAARGRSSAALVELILHRQHEEELTAD